jgi:uncharacterized protein with LGFP repeats
MDQEPFPEKSGHGLNSATDVAGACRHVIVPLLRPCGIFIQRVVPEGSARGGPYGTKRGDQRASGGAWNVNFNNGNVNWNNLDNDNYVRAVRP